MYPRKLTVLIENELKNPEIILLFGARRTGKSTLLNMLKDKYPEMEIFNCDNPLVSDILQTKNTETIINLFERGKIVAFDEAQTVPDIGLILKLLYDDRDSNTKFIATGSSSFDLADRTGEPLTGRNISYNLFPLSLSEIKEKTGLLKLMERLNDYLVYGTYPGIVDMNNSDKIKRLIQLSSDYLFKDILKFERLKNPDLLRQLLKALALQVGSQVSVQELSQLLKISAITVERYLDLLQKSFIIYKLLSFSSNLRNEIKKSKKYYFYDNGIRNALINNFNPVADRPDAGALWENFCVVEMLKKVEYEQRFSNLYFWRTYDGAEIDLVEEKGGEIFAYEFKWKARRKAGIPKSFAEKYNVKQFEVITPDNIFKKLL
ncbi:MAG: ATP-binding protein [Chlorobi bacterium]|nr:ATP-binding protein [Chlorobiota bacterium]